MVKDRLWSLDRLWQRRLWSHTRAKARSTLLDRYPLGEPTGIPCGIPLRGTTVTIVTVFRYFIAKNAVPATAPMSTTRCSHAHNV
jgi:hypothetical protein